MLNTVSKLFILIASLFHVLTGGTQPHALDLLH